MRHARALVILVTAAPGSLQCWQAYATMAFALACSNVVAKYTDATLSMPLSEAPTTVPAKVPTISIVPLDRTRFNIFMNSSSEIRSRSRSAPRRGPPSATSSWDPRRERGSAKPKGCPNRCKRSGEHLARGSHRAVAAGTQEVENAAPRGSHQAIETQ